MKEVEDLQTKLNRATTMWIRCFGLGKEHGAYNIKRLLSAHISKALVIPSLYTMEKDHKPYKEGGRWPESRPVCGAKVCINSGLSDLVSEFLDICKDYILGGRESTSTEDMCARIEEVKALREAQAFIEDAKRKKEKVRHTWRPWEFPPGAQGTHGSAPEQDDRTSAHSCNKTQLEGSTHQGDDSKQLSPTTHTQVYSWESHKVPSCHRYVSDPGHSS